LSIIKHMQLMTIQSFLNGSVYSALIGTLIVLMLSSCGSNIKDVGLSEMRKDIEMRKGPCYGRCPVYTLRVYEKGIVTYEGERFTDRLGIYIKRIPEEQYVELLETFQKVNLWQFDDVYKGDIPDAQTVSITYIEEGDFKSVTGKDGRPDDVMKLEILLESIASNKQDWVLKQKPPSAFPDYVITEEIIVQLPEEVNINRWVRKYRKNRMVLKKQLREESPYWLITYDKDTITPKEILDKIRRDQQVQSAEFNKKTKWRT